MSRFTKLFAANAIAAAGLCSAAVALSASAAAEPVVPPMLPGVPALFDLATSPAGVGAVLQTAATALNGASALVGAPAPNTLPVSPIQTVPTAPVGLSPLAPAAYLPVAYPPVAPAPVAAPTLPGQSLAPLLSGLGVPANLIGLAPTQLPGFSPAAPVAPVAAPLPVAPLPVAPLLVDPAAGVPAPNPLLTALP